MKIIKKSLEITIEIEKCFSCPFWNSIPIQEIVNEKHYPSRKKTLKKLTLRRYENLNEKTMWDIKNYYFLGDYESGHEILESIYKKELLRKDKLERLIV